MLVSIDLSLRSSGVVVLDKDGSLVDFMLVTPAVSDYRDEVLLTYISNEIIDFVYTLGIHAIVIEGLSFNSFSSEKDKINGNFWHLRCELAEEFPEVPIGIIPVTSWRASVIPKADQKEIKKTSDKEAIKKACVARLPEEVRKRFTEYLQENSHSKKGIYDLTDAYWLGQFRLSLDK